MCLAGPGGALDGMGKAADHMCWSSPDRPRQDY